jgi:hypothetical protein
VNQEATKLDFFPPSIAWELKNQKMLLVRIVSPTVFSNHNTHCALSLSLSLSALLRVSSFVFITGDIEMAKFGTNSSLEGNVKFKSAIFAIAVHFDYG